MVQSFELPDPLNTVLPEFAVELRTPIRMFPAGDVMNPETDMTVLLPATEVTAPLAITVVPS